MTTIEQLRHFAPLDYRYQFDDALASLEPHTEATLAGLTEANLSQKGCQPTYRTW